MNLSPCRFANHKSELLCAKYPVFEDRANKSGRVIALNIVVVPAERNQPANDPVFFLTGGPGQGAARIAARGEDALMRELRRERDLVFVDLRGTGDSNGLRCDIAAGRSALQNYFADLFQSDLIRSCRDALQQRADLRLYTTSLAVEDLDEIRAALDYEKIILHAASYGTQAALEYIRRYPQHVRSAALAGVATPEAKIPLHFAKAAEDAMTKLLDDCAADPGCATTFPKLREEFAKVLGRFDDGVVTFAATHPITKKVQSVRLARGIFVERLRLMLYQHNSARLLPLLIHRAANGDWNALASLMLTARAPAAFDVALGMYLSVTCAESLPRISDDDVARETRGTFLGEYRTHRHQQACREWPQGTVPAEYYRPVQSDLPVLILSGDLDPATPAHYGAAAARHLPNSRQVVLRNTPHSYDSECARKLIAEFIDKGSAKELNVECAHRLRRPRFLTDLPAGHEQ